MTISVTHAFVSTKAQSADATVTSKNEWNAAHTLSMATGTMLGRTTASAGAVEEITPNTVDFSLAAGALALSQPEYIRVLDADAAGTNVNTAQPIFPTTGTFTALGSTTYLFDSFLHITRAAGVTSHATGLLFGGTATFTSVRYEAITSNPTGTNQGTPNQYLTAVATVVAVTGANISATENLYIQWNGILRVNSAGTIIPQFQYDNAPGGAPTIKANTYFRLKKIGTSAVTAVGAWA